jgi:hypothetical protein
MVVHCKKSRYDIYIGRPSKWGNPFEITTCTTRDKAISMYEDWIRNNPTLLADLHELEGKVLGCWCSPKPCHGDVLLKLLSESAIPKNQDT